MRRALIGCALVAVLAACGARTPLEPPPGQSLPVAPAARAEPPTSDELLEVPPEARPVRVDELLTESEEREDDRFDLPPD